MDESYFHVALVGTDLWCRDKLINSPIFSAKSDQCWPTPDRYISGCS